jgi:hypothetical protein
MSISSHENGGQSLSVGDLALRMILSGLPRNHVKIRISACEGTTFAQYLALTLGRGLDVGWFGTRGGTRPDPSTSYQHIKVAGYKTKIFFDPAQRTLVWAGRWPEPNTHNSGQVVWYDSNGNETAKPSAWTVEEVEAANALVEFSQAARV